MSAIERPGAPMESDRLPVVTPWKLSGGIGTHWGALLLCPVEPLTIGTMGRNHPLCGTRCRIVTKEGRTWNCTITGVLETAPRQYGPGYIVSIRHDPRHGKPR